MAPFAANPESWATPCTFTGAEPRMTPSARNVTFPPASAGKTVAVSCEVPSDRDCVCTIVSVGARSRFAACMVTADTADELDAKVLFALNSAVMECDPLARDAVLNTASFPVSAIVPRDCVPSKKVTPPKGVPLADETVAVKLRTVPVVLLPDEEDSLLVVGNADIVTCTAGDELGESMEVV